MNEPLFYAEPVLLSQLNVDSVYFMLNYFDDHMLIPHLRTLVYLGRDLKGETDGLLYFQDYESFKEWGRYPEPTDGSGTIVRCMADKISCIFELDKAVKSLQQCLTRRAQK